MFFSSPILRKRWRVWARWTFWGAFHYPCSGCHFPFLWLSSTVISLNQSPINGHFIYFQSVAVTDCCSVQSLSCVQLFATPWVAARQASLSITNSQSSLTTWGVPLSVCYHFAFSYCSWGSQGKNTEMVCHSLLQWTTNSCEKKRSKKQRRKGKIQACEWRLPKHNKER